MCLLKFALNLSRFFLWEVLTAAQPQALKHLVELFSLYTNLHGFAYADKDFFLAQLGQNVFHYKINHAPVGGGTRIVGTAPCCSFQFVIIQCEG